MPNWCENRLTGPKEILATLISKDEEGVDFFDFDKIVPMPAHQPDVNKPNPFYREGDLTAQAQKIFGKNNWYDWSIENWGTKWNTSSCNIDLENGVVYFDTAWSPAELIFANLIQKFEGYDWKLYYDEGGMGFRGRIEYEANSDEVSETDLSWHYDVQLDECPHCKNECMYTSEGSDNYVIKRCDDCGFEVLLDKNGIIITSGKEDSICLEKY